SNQQSGSQQPGWQAASNGQPSPNAAQSSDQSNGMNSGSGEASAGAPQAPPPPAVVSLPAGTSLRVRLDQDLGSKVSQPGDSFSATIEDAVVVDGQTVIPRGATAEGTVIDAKPLGRFKGGAVLSIRLERVHTKWGSYPVATSSIARAEKGKGKRTGIFAAGGGGFGALVGGLAGGGKGAVIGGLAGAGAGTATSAFTGNKEIFLPAETMLTFRLEHSVHITEQQQ
ncbi:MAG: hypothetical protein ACRD3S_03210, partial [Terracidiphilus sp.]